MNTFHPTVTALAFGLRSFDRCPAVHRTLRRGRA
jgi:hypothetical protein